MSIGLNSEQLMSILGNCFVKRAEEIKGSLEAIKAGESPEQAKFINDITAKYPNIPVEAGVLIGLFTIALMDTIEANNKALSKVIPHVEI